MKHLLTLGLAVGLLATAPAEAALYSFSQGGFEQGATISGWFEVNDLNGNDHILAGQSFLGYTFDEISAFNLSFSGNSLVAAFTHSLADLTLFSYKLGTPILGDEVIPNYEAIGSNWFSSLGYAYSTGIGTGLGWTEVEDLTTGSKSYSEAALQVRAVPLPGALWLFGSALAGLIGLKRRLQ